jgi:hypothetical protein
MDDFLSEIGAAFAATLGEPAIARAPKLVTCQVERGLLPEDIAQYVDQHGNLTTTVKAASKDIRLLREKHHGVARLLAQGIPEGVVAEMTNYTPQYISVLKAAPAMVELIEHYRSSANAAAQHIGEKLRVVADMSLEMLRTRLEADGLSNHELIATAKLGFDRSGHGPQTNVHNVNEHHIIDHAEIAARHEAAKQRDRELIVHPETIRPHLLPKPDEEQAA